MTNNPTPSPTTDTGRPHVASVRQVSREQVQIELELVTRVLASFDDCADERLKLVMQSLVTHLHSFIRAVRLTEEEWNTAIEFLTAAGHITDDKRQEFVLLSDTLGASMQTIAINNQTYRDATEATVFGPFFVEDAPRIEIGWDMAGGAAGQPCWVEGTVKDTDGNPGLGSRSGRRIMTVSTMSSMRTDESPGGPTCSPTTGAITPSGV